MSKLYITHDPAELAMAFVQAQCCLFGFYFAVNITAAPLVLRFVVGELGLFAGLVCYVFLFKMSGSKKRRDAAQQSEA